MFGPPGTSKTTLARCVADAIGWDYVEIHSSHFVAEGLPNVQRRADTIFNELMQLDRTVILFDEIDELVRAREMEPDAFGRFLTTSMLPKLAELWTARKVIYFVATNHIRFFDPAVTRAQRFDALIHVAPPGFKRKIERIRELLSGVRLTAVRFTRRDVEKAVKQAAELCKNRDQAIASADSLAKFLLVRWDQLPQLAAAIRRRKPAQIKITLTRAIIEQALNQITDRRLSECDTYKDFLASATYEQHDFSKVTVWRVPGAVPAKCRKKVNDGFYVSPTGFGDFSLLKCKATVVPPDVLHLR